MLVPVSNASFILRSLQIIGFVVLVAGSVIFNEIVYIPGLMPPKNADEGTKPLLAVEDMDEFTAPSPLLPTVDNLMTPTLSKITTTKQR